MKKKCHAGIAFDGDADKCIAVDEQGDIIDGDKILAILAKKMSEDGHLQQNGFVTSVESNLGLQIFAKKQGITLVSAKVGERFILERMCVGGYNLGGEPNGTIIFRDDLPVSDGQLTAIRLLSAMISEKKRLSELASVVERCPQVITSVKIPSKAREVWKNDDIINEAVEKLTAEIGDDGRLIVRESGTESAIKIIVEGRQFELVNKILLEMASVVKKQTKRFSDENTQTDDERKG